MEKESQQSIDLAATERILLSARKQIAENGILGLRVAEVAEGAHSSVTQIYRYFGDRNGLLARVLGDMYEEFLVFSLQSVRDTLDRLPAITIDDIVDALPCPTQERVRVNSAMRLQILAAAVTNDQLRERVSSIACEQMTRWSSYMDDVVSRMADGESFDRRVFTIMLVMQMPYYRHLLGDSGFSEQDYQQFLRDKLKN